MKLFDPGPSDRSTSLGLLILRLAAGGAMLSHGIPKAMKFAELKETFPDPLGIGHLPSLLGAVSSEVLFAALVVVGFATRLATIPLIFTMGVAALVVHGSDPFEKKELAVLYGAMFIVIFFTGPGRFSIDGRKVGGG